jgi:hypothetical protein
MPDSREADSREELLTLSQRLLDAIAAGDWSTYEKLCAPDLTTFEPEAQGHRVAGLGFHRFYFGSEPSGAVQNTTMVDPQVRCLGDDAALVTYVRLVQTESAQGWVTQRTEESRVWQRRDGRWWHVHFHRSANGQD